MSSDFTCIDIKNVGTPEVLNLKSGKMPEPKSEEILIEIKAAGINRADILQRKGLYPPPATASPILGLECAGVVAGLGKNATSFKIGDKVCALLAGGGYASHVTVDESLALPIPNNLDFAQAAALPEACATAWLNLINFGWLKEDQTVLIHGGGGGIGTTAIQIANLIGARSIVTVGSDEKVKRAEQLGAVAINYNKQDFANAVMTHTQDQGVDVILDHIGASYVDQHLKVIKSSGRWLMIGLMGGMQANLNLATFVRKNIMLKATTLRTMDLDCKAKLLEDIHKDLWPFIESGRFKPVIDAIFPLNEASKAHAHMEENRHFGKIILEIP